MSIFSLIADVSNFWEGYSNIWTHYWFVYLLFLFLDHIASSLSSNLFKSNAMKLPLRRWLLITIERVFKFHLIGLVTGVRFAICRLHKHVCRLHKHILQITQTHPTHPAICRLHKRILQFADYTNTFCNSAFCCIIIGLHRMWLISSNLSIDR